MFNSSPLGDFVFYINIGTDMRRAIIEFSSPNGAFIFISVNMEKITTKNNDKVFVPIRGFCFLYYLKKFALKVKTAVGFRPRLGILFFICFDTNNVTDMSYMCFRPH